VLASPGAPAIERLMMLLTATGEQGTPRALGTPRAEGPIEPLHCAQFQARPQDLPASKRSLKTGVAVQCHKRKSG
jgi:hypothetical protein